MIAIVLDGLLDSGLFLESFETCNYNVGIDAPVSEKIMLYPNPANETLYVERADDMNGTLFIHDMNGTLVMEESIPDAESSINISTLNPGIYMVTIESGDNVSRSKLTVN